MKQRITTSQLMELTPSQQEKLRAWWSPQGGDLACIGRSWGQEIGRFMGFGDKTLHFHNISSVPRENCLPLLNIGQMLELIDTHGGYIRYQYIVGTSRNSCLPSEFCDQLWNDIKSIL